MGSLREEAKAYVPEQTMNITELDYFPVDVQVEDREAVNKDNEKFSYKVILYNDGEYRIPKTVLGQIKTILEKFPDTKFVTVSKEGKDKQTRYTTLPHPGKP